MKNKSHNCLRITVNSLIYKASKTEAFKICVKKGNTKPGGREAFYFEFYNKIGLILSLGNEAGMCFSVYLVKFM